MTGSRVNKRSQPWKRADDGHENGAGDGSFPTSTQLPSRAALFVQEFAVELRVSVPQLEHVFVREQSDYVTVYVICSGDVDALEDRIYELEAMVLARFPDVLIDLHVLDAVTPDVDAKTAGAYEIAA